MMNIPEMFVSASDLVKSRMLSYQGWFQKQLKIIILLVAGPDKTGVRGSDKSDRMNALQKAWIEHGYQVFASQGPHGLRVEPLARGMGKNKSSFYHHFADMEVFTDMLLDYHLQQAQLLARKESGCETSADLIAVLVEHKADLLFSRQLRVHREKRAFEACFVKTNEISLPAILGIWSRIMELRDNSYLSGLVLELSLENFFLQITDDTLNQSWLGNYFGELRTLVRAFKTRYPPHHQTIASEI